MLAPQSQLARKLGEQPVNSGDLLRVFLVRTVNPSVGESLQRCAERAANARMARAGVAAPTRVA